VTSPNKKRHRLTVIQKVDDFDKNAIRQKVHSFWLNRQIPTVLKMLMAVNEDESLPNFKHTSLYILLKSMNFVYEKKKKIVHSSKGMTLYRGGEDIWRV